MRTKRIIENPVFCRLLKLCNTIYYAFSNKNKILIADAMIYQLFNKIYSNNLGDDLNAYLLGELTGKRVLAFGAFHHFHRHIDSVMAIGSVIDWMGHKNSTVWGSGIQSPPEQGVQPHYLVGKVCAVRGKKTMDCLRKAGVLCPEVFGDPALLMPLVYRPSVTKVEGRVGIIPHYVDVDNANAVRLLKELGNKGVLIPVRGYKRWQDVIDMICSCEFIISSSLHGLILADAYQIPNQWVKFSDLISGGSFKYEDYYSAVGKKACMIEIDDQTTAQDIIDRKTTYQKIVFDPYPLLRAFPFEIKNPGILKLLSSPN